MTSVNGRTETEVTPLVWQATPVDPSADDMDIQEAQLCSLCKTWVVGSCQTIQDMRDCRNLDETDLTPVCLVPA